MAEPAGDGAADIVIRPAATGDLLALLALYRHLNHDDPDMDLGFAEDRFAAILAHPGMTIFVAFEGNLAVSSITLVVIPNLTRRGASYALIENVVTHADHRQRGHARALIKTAIATAWEKNCYKVMLLTGSKEPATLRFYAKCGFTQDKTGFQIRRPAAG
ncbi:MULTISPECIES: GNAT family N-acetyltransferase [Rhizobium]|uniref:GNAT superfamily N-acetyltransferase n=1 Tax=Rhizobium paranaense TaxID=1650438 RepID=A0A7W8XQ24_9HYPH|nr:MULTISPECIES: GNAT family N-acetyltransferase [Rhizobium]MBB5573204.1 GNAT superfamily N-acetyltransferase [Rhizobium paranaense]PST62426.1 GNAT family N-acetyltransferase [Rhizobium sp. SEMIA4064]